MKHMKIIIGLGILVALVPFLGFPTSWKNIIFAVLGLAIAGMAFRLFTHIRDTKETPKDNHTSSPQTSNSDDETDVEHE